MGDEHLIMVAGSSHARMWHQRHNTSLPPASLVAVQGGDVVSVEMPQGCAFCAIQVEPSLFNAVMGPGAGGTETIGMRQFSFGLAWARRF